jgi:hypothetical protein
MAIKVTVNWRLTASDEVDFSYQVGPLGMVNEPALEEAREESEAVVDRVLPLGSSVVSPGLSLPLPT